MKTGFQQKMGVVLLWCMGLSALYFSFYLLMGGNNIFAMSEQRHKLAASAEKLEQQKTERAALEDKVIRLRPETLDWDKAETEAVKVLGERARMPEKQAPETKQP